jgi:competence protein ComFB
MLTSYSLSDVPASLDSVHNYYEHMVIGEIHKQLGGRTVETDFIADVACVALNHLPPRYIRYDVDMAFYLSPKESMEMEEKVSSAVSAALAFVEKRGNRA